MKTKLKFTRGEMTAAVAMLVLIFASNIFYYCYRPRVIPHSDFAKYEANFQKFIEQQKMIADSISTERNKKDKYHIRSDTVPKYDKTQKKPLYQIVRVNINKCDTNDLKAIPQFGSKRAAKLVDYRDKLGGFYSLEQLSEVYVLQNIDTAKLKAYLYIGTGETRRININTASYKEIVAHPYFDVYLAKQILKYREKEGKINNLQELQEITHAYPELMARLKHYICF